jgi:hypothetical protein
MERSVNARRRYGPTLIAIALVALLIALLCTVCVPMHVYAAQTSARIGGDYTHYSPHFLR